MPTIQKCIQCNIEKELMSFDRNSKNGKKYGYRKRCKKCRTKKWIKRPLWKSKYDSRFKWDSASYDEKLKHTRIVYESNISTSQNCWDWIGLKDKDGYGFMTYEKKHWSGHRISWFLHHGPIPEDKWVLHTCDNRACTNPEHLYLGTPKQNFADMINRGRRKVRIGEECNFAKLSERKVRNIKKLLQKKVTHKYIAKKYKVSRGAISDIARNKNWKHVTLD